MCGRFAPRSAGGATRAYLSTSQNRFWQSINWSGRPQSDLKSKPETLELLLLEIGHESDQFGLVEAAGIGEAFAQPIASAGARDNEIHFAEIGNLAVIDVSDELIREEIANGRISPQLLEALLHGAGLRQPFGKSVLHHAFEQ